MLKLNRIFVLVFLVCASAFPAGDAADHDDAKGGRAADRYIHESRRYQSSSAMVTFSIDGLKDQFRGFTNLVGGKMGKSLSCAINGTRCGFLIEADGSLAATAAIGDKIDFDFYDSYTNATAAEKTENGKKKINLCGMEFIYKKLNGPEQRLRDNSTYKQGRDVACRKGTTQTCCAFFFDTEGHATPANPDLGTR